MSDTEQNQPQENTIQDSETKDTAATEQSNEDQIKQLEQTISELKTQRLKDLADLDNQRKRLAKEKEQWTKYSHESFARDLLQILDNFENAINQSTDDVSAIKEGIQLNLKLFVDTLKKHGVEEVDALSQKFDPNFHSAVAQEETSEHPDGHVIEVFQRGYRIHQRLLRPSMVKVAKNNSSAEKGSNTPSETNIN